MPKQNYENHLHLSEARWFAVYTNFKREKIALKELERKGVVAYLPLQKVIRRYERKTKKVELPLISCYLFVKITKEEYVKVLETEYILNFVKFSKNLIAIPEIEIDLLKRVLGENVEVALEKATFNEGDEVEIMTGNLVGLKGKLISHEGKKNVMIELKQLGYSLRLNLDMKLLRKVVSSY